MRGRELVLVGAGHAHLQVLHALQFSNLKITLISDVPLAPYSGMLPGYLAGIVSENEMLFDLENLCTRFGYRFLQQAVTSIDHDKKSLELSDGRTISFDVCSLNVGILPQSIPSDSAVSNIIYVKPISNFLAKWKTAMKELTIKGNVIVIGGGAAAFELAIACGIRFPSRVFLVAGVKGLTLPPGAAGPARRAMEDLGVELIEGQKVDRMEEGTLRMGEVIKPFALAIVAITARPAEIVQHSILPKSLEGHVLVDDFLRVKGSSVMFAAGDCAYFESKPLPKAGVHAVRQGPILAHNILSTLEARIDLKRYLPQEKFLSILITGTDEAIFCWRGFAFRARWAAVLKRWIDRRFMKKFS